MTPKAFRKTVLDYYEKYGRHTLPWRPPSLKFRRDTGTLDPYRILVSEVMLQQTQVDRVIPKYHAFLKKFPTLKKLAQAPLREVLMEWKGLGYNRRGLNLQRMAQTVVNEHKGKIPSDKKQLINLPGIGPYTAGAVRAFAWNEPDVFIETNIRTVYIHHYTDVTRLPAGRQGLNADKDGKISDKELIKFIERDIKKIVQESLSPRDWYYALMDYGSHLKKTFGNASRKSKTYTKQSKFEGSNRQLRALVLHEVAETKAISIENIAKKIGKKKSDVSPIVKELEKDGFVKVKGSKVVVL